MAVNYKANWTGVTLGFLALVGFAAYDVSRFPAEQRAERARYLGKWAIIGFVLAIPAIVVFSLVMYELMMLMP